MTALLGHTALVESATVEATGTVARVEDGRLTLSWDEDPGDWPPGKPLEATISVFAPDALYRIEGRGAPTGSGELVMEPGVLVERIQRRRWARRRMDLSVTLCPMRDGRRVEGIPGSTVDVGVGGLCAETLRPVDCAGDIMVILSLPDGTTAVCAARPVAVEDLGDGWRYRLAFKDLDAHDTARLAALTSG